MPYFGEIAALITALFWSTSAIFFGLAGQRIGSVVINRLRLILSLFFLVAIHWLLFAAPLPVEAEAERWFWLVLSGIIGLALGDTLLFQAYILIGPRLAMLLKSLAPIFSALLAWIFLAEILSLGQIGGILLTIGGISWVILIRDQEKSQAQSKQTMAQRKPGFSISLTTIPYLKSGPIAGAQNLIAPDEAAKRYLWGILCGVGTAACQAIGLILAKKGLGGDFSALSGNLIRMLGAVVLLWGITFFQGQVGPTVQQLLVERQVSLNIIAGTFLGPVIGVWFSLLAVQQANVGIASTLMALTPIFMLPSGYFIFKERFGGTVIAGTVAAVIGVGLLFLGG